jgi:4-amino-4-deoxy-L-arabinose transferase-like glycosyltransferase
MFNFLKRLTPWQASILLLLSTALLRAFAGSHIGLSVDEAHYALYGLYLDWSYFDHPPMIGWLQALVLPFGQSDFAMRLMPIALFTLTGGVLYGLTVTLFPRQSPWVGFVSVLLLQSGAMLQLIGLAMLPDTPLLLFGLLSVWTLHLIVIQGREKFWLALGVLLGLAALSKYTAVTLVLTVLLSLLIHGQWRQLRTPWPWLAILLSLLIIFPILYWNAQHAWISFLYQLNHGTGKPTWEIERFGLSQAAQLLAYGPALMIFGLIAVLSNLAKWREPAASLCLALALPILLLFAWGAGFEMTLPHWVALAWTGLAPLTADWLCRHWSWRWVRWSFSLSIAYSLLAILLIFNEFIHPFLPFKDNQNPLKDLYGWQAAAQRAEQLRRELPAQTTVNAPVLFTENWTFGSRLAWYARPSSVQITDQRYDQFDVWFDSPKADAHGILVLWPTAQAIPLTGGKGQFSHCQLRERMPVSVNQHLVSTFSFYACDGFKP